MDAKTIEKKLKELEERVRKLEDIISSSAYQKDKDLMDAYYKNAKDLVIKHQKASVIFLQRKLLIDVDRATRLIDDLEKNGIIGPNEGFNPRKILVKE